VTGVAARPPAGPIKENNMGGIGNKSEPPRKDDGAAKKPLPAAVEDDDIEDGDFATPKRDRSDDDDQPA
jgi:hypothetical protein